MLNFMAIVYEIQMKSKKKKNPKNFFFVKLGIFCLEWEKNILFGIGNGAKFRPQNLVIESPVSLRSLGV